jgi:hypothetical protein
VYTQNKSTRALPHSRFLNRKKERKKDSSNKKKKRNVTGIDFAPYQ